MNTNLISSFGESIFSNIADITADLSEVGIDSLLDNGIIKDIPIVNTIYKLGSIAISVREKHLLHKTLVFIQEINNGIISDEDRCLHKKQLESNPKKMERELGFILVSIDRHLQSIKSKILARFYSAYLDSSNSYDWIDFCILSEILDEISIYDFEALIYIQKRGTIEIGNNIEEISFFQISRLEKCGVIYVDMVKGDNNSYAKRICLSPQGIVFCKLSKIEDLIREEGIADGNREAKP